MIKFRHVGVLVSNIQKAIDFYGQFGLKVVINKTVKGRFIQTVLGVPGLALTYVKMCVPPDPTPWFELHHWNQTDVVYGLRNKFTSHVAFTMENLRKFYDKNRDKINFISPPRMASDSKALVCFVTDPDQNLIELVEEKKRD